MYTTIKIVHASSAFISIVGFFIRGIFMIKKSNLLNTKVSKIAPHIIDTILLASAITLAVMSSQYPITHNWLSAKILGLLIYIGLGLWAFRFGKTPQQKITAWFFALIVFSFIVFFAITKPF